MSSLSLTNGKYMDWSLSGAFNKIKNLMECFYRSTEFTLNARIWHGDFSYRLVPGTSISNIHNISPVTMIDAGECYVCIFEKPGYQGEYRIIGPGERIQIGDCKSIVTSQCKIAADTIRRNARPPAGYWEMDGPMYIIHFSSAYRYAG
ncbi:MAG: hypothetical protein ACOY46_05975 [Bacillota bacterium]